MSESEYMVYIWMIGHVICKLVKNGRQWYVYETDSTKQNFEILLIITRGDIYIYIFVYTTHWNTFLFD